MEDVDDRRQRALDLLSGAHAFPGPFELRILVVPSARVTVVDAVRARLGQGGVTEVTERASRRGRWLSIRMVVEVDLPETVLDLYEILRAVDGVVTVL